MREKRKVRLKIVLAAFLTAQRIADLMHGTQVDDVVPLLLERLVAVLAHVLKNDRKTSLKKNKALASCPGLRPSCIGNIYQHKTQRGCITTGVN